MKISQINQPSGHIPPLFPVINGHRLVKSKKRENGVITGSFPQMYFIIKTMNNSR
ncbi:MAG: hypothetical protein ACTSYZ_04550 [Candidatus Helarchaeota archaeon]